MRIAGSSLRRVVLSFSVASLLALVSVYLLNSDGTATSDGNRDRTAESLALPRAPDAKRRVLSQVNVSRPAKHYHYDDGIESEGTAEKTEDDEDVLDEDTVVEEEEGEQEEKESEVVYDTDAAATHLSTSFSIRKGFNFPHPKVFLPTQKIMSANWVTNLKTYLRSIHPARSITITVATKSFIPNLLNWLIAANRLVQPPIENTLVLAFDKDVFNLLTPRKIPCIYVPYKSVLKKLKKDVKTIWMTRLAVIRVLNHWGYNVLQLDSDAVPLKNPSVLFDQLSGYDIVAARGILPFELGHGPWGFTVCMGVALLRGTHKMETLWNFMHGSKVDKTTDDQKRINFALLKSKFTWKTKENQFTQPSVGTNENGVKVAVLPRKYVCRKTCKLEKGSDIFVWHQSGGGHSASWKSKQNRKSTVWFLRSDYTSRPAAVSVTGLQWLDHLTQPGSIDSVREALSGS